MVNSDFLNGMTVEGRYPRHDEVADGARASAIRKANF